MKWSRRRQVLIFVSFVASAVILWIDIATGLWQDYVILAGLAAGLVSFGLTSLVIDRIITRANQQQWQPVTRLALSDILHALADEERSEIARGTVVPVRFPEVEAPGPEELDRIRARVLDERTRLASAISGWSTFLASSADATVVLDHAAELAESLDGIRDLSLEVEVGTGAVSLTDLNAEIMRYNAAATALAEELKRAIAMAARDD